MADFSSRVSLCIPVFNVENYIERCAVSLFEQSYRNIEYIFVDDCSQDRSMAILDGLLTKYSALNVKVIHHEHNRGLAAARNTAIEAATGEFVIHVDSDDWLETDAVELLVLRQNETNADIVSANAIAHYPDYDEYLIEPDYADKGEMMQDIIQLSINHVLWRRIIRKSLYVNNSIAAIEGKNVGEDHYTLPRLLYYADSFAKLDRIIYHYDNTNAYSYMARASIDIGINYLKNNIESCDILSDFFSDKSSSIAKEVDLVRQSYIDRAMHVSLVYGRREVYRYLSSVNTGFKSCYYFERMRIIVFKVLHKITGNKYKMLQ